MKSSLIPTVTGLGLSVAHGNHSAPNCQHPDLQHPGARPLPNRALGLPPRRASRFTALYAFLTQGVSASHTAQHQIPDHLLDDVTIQPLQPQDRPARRSGVFQLPLPRS